MKPSSKNWRKKQCQLYDYSTLPDQCYVTDISIGLYWLVLVKNVVIPRRRIKDFLLLKVWFPDLILCCLVPVSLLPNPDGPGHVTVHLPNQGQVQAGGTSTFTLSTQANALLTLEENSISIGHLPNKGQVQAGSKSTFTLSTQTNALLTLEENSISIGHLPNKGQASQVVSPLSPSPLRPMHSSP
jgi:hypothetical protein